MVAAAELTYNTSASAFSMANTIFGPGVTVTGASFTGDRNSIGTWSSGDSLSPLPTPSDTGVIISTGRIRDFTNSTGDANQSNSTSTNTFGQNGNTQFNAAAGAATYDATWIDVDFIPTGNVLTISFTFASDEYPEYANSIYNDIVGVWINGTFVTPEIGPNTSVSTVNQNEHRNLYNDNTADQHNTEMDGFTVTMSLTIPVNSGVVNSIRIGVADVFDVQNDSSVLIAADSAQTQLIAVTDDLEMQINSSATINPLTNDQNNTLGTLTITHINGIAVNFGDSVTLATGQTVTLNPDGTFTVVSNGDVVPDATFTYTVSNGLGLSDVGYVTLSTIPCFVAGTQIQTPSGPRTVQHLAEGDLVTTLDHGPQPVRWIGRRLVRATGEHAPVVIAAGTFGDHPRLSVSPLHRILIRDSLAELLFGEAEVLVAARDLVDGRRIRQTPGGWVEYVHILFDRHEIVLSNGVATESFLPGPQSSDAYEAAALAEIRAIFPDFDPATGRGYTQSARRALRPFEARAVRRAA